MDNTREYTQFQLFVLTYLYARELEEGKLRESDPCRRIIMGKEDFVRVTPGEILPENLDNELRILRQDLLLTDVGEKYFLDHVDGQSYVKKYLHPLASKVPDQRQTENIIDNTQGKAEIRSYFKGLLSRLREKSQDEIIDGLISGTKQYGPIAVMFLMKMTQHHIQ